MIISKQIEQKIKTLPEGTLLFIDDFIEEYDYETARKILQRLTNDGQLRRLTRGIYYIPKKDNLLGIIKPTAEQIAESIAKRDKARIIPTGSFALHKLGLTTQIPMNVVYLTDGSPRKIKVGNQKITFKKTSPKILAVKHHLSGLIIQGLKEIGERKVNASHLSQIKKIIIQSHELSQIKMNLRYAPVWIQKIVLKIINDLKYEQLAKPI
jgi:hypothetical protein